jgi:hypothetical protein
MVQRSTGEPDEGWVFTCTCLTDGNFGRNLAKAREAYRQHLVEVGE